MHRSTAPRSRFGFALPNGSSPHTRRIPCGTATVEPYESVTFPADAMNFATMPAYAKPAHETLPDAASVLLERFVERAAEHHLPCMGPSFVRIVVTGEPVRALTLEMSETLAIVADDCPPDATVTFTSGTLHAALLAPGLFDARIPEFASGIRIEGHALTAQYLLQLLKRPESRILARFNYARARAPRTLDRVPECDTPDASRVVEALTGSVPLRLRGVLRLPALEWSLDELIARHGQMPLRHDSIGGRAQTLGDFLGSWRGQAPGADAPYSAGCPLSPQLAALFPFPHFSTAGAYHPVAQLWAGVRREHALVTPLHCDVAASFLAQIHGRKKFWLFAPWQHELLYPIGGFNTYQPCCVDAAQPDLDRFPRFAQARPIEVTIEPGDLLVIPTGWYHCVWALDDVISVSRFMDDAWAVARYLPDRQA